MSGYRVTLLSIAFDIRAGNQTQALTLSSPFLVLFILPKELTDWTKPGWGVGSGERGVVAFSLLTPGPRAQSLPITAGP